MASQSEDPHQLSEAETVPSTPEPFDKEEAKLALESFLNLAQ